MGEDSGGVECRGNIAIAYRVRDARLCAVLWELGYTLQEISGEAVEQILQSSTAPNLIAIGSDLPDFSEFCLDLQANAHLAAIPKLAFGPIDSLGQRDLERLGIVDWIVPPWEPQTLALRLASHLRSSQQIHRLSLENAKLADRVEELEQKNWLHARSHQQAIVSIVNQLRDEIIARIHQHLRTYLQTPHTICRRNYEAILSGHLNHTDYHRLEHWFWQQLQVFPEINAIQFASESGDYIGVIRMEDGSFTTEVKTDAQMLHKLVFRLDERGYRTKQLVGISPNYDPRQRQWYRAALQADEATWGEIYQFSSNTTAQIGIMAVLPVRDRTDCLLGVLGTDITPWQIGDFLRGLKIGRTGLTFVMEHTGLLVATSTPDRPFIVVDGKANRIQTHTAEDRTIRAIAKHMEEHFGSFARIDAPAKLEFLFDNQRQFMQVMPFRDGKGIDWAIVLNLPESDFADPDSQRDTRSQISDAFAVLDRANKELELRVKQRTAELEKAKVEAEIASRAKSEFLSKMSHELRTPLNAILGFTQLMQRDLLSETQREHLHLVSQNGEYLLSLIDDILVVTEMDSENAVLDRRTVDLPAFLLNLQDSIRQRAAAKGLPTNLEMAPDLPQQIRVDEMKLRQILINLLTNAIKFTRQGHVTIRAKTMRESKAHAYLLCIEVEDTGVGIAAEHLSAIFEPFAQPHWERSSRDGTGLGLTIVRHFAGLLGGDIQVQSQVGKGTCFTLTIPVVVLDRSPVNSPVNPNLPRPKTRDVRILLVEDDIVNQKVLLMMLERLGYRADIANNGLEALERLEQTFYDIILMDIQMPKMNGLVAAERICSRWPDNHPAIVAVSANALPADRERSLQAGMVEHLGKPVRLEELRKTLERWGHGQTRGDL